METIINIRGTEYTLRFEKQNYAHGHNLAIEVLCWNKEFEFWERYGLLTVNLPNTVLAENRAFLDSNKCSEEILKWIFDNNYAQIIGQGQSGFCTYHLVEFSAEFLEMIAA